jgi:hypothetical protein
VWEYEMKEDQFEKQSRPAVYMKIMQIYRNNFKLKGPKIRIETGRS